MERRRTTVVVVGAGLAGARCAETLRAAGFDGRVVLVGDERAAPYERPALSKELLAGTRSPSQLALRPEGFWAGQDIELVLGARATSMETSRRRLWLADGRAIRWDALVLATGTRARRLPGPRAPSGVHYLRTLADAESLAADLHSAHRLAVVGGGFVGTEVASTARRLGLDVTLVDRAAVPFERALGAEVGTILAERYRTAGVELVLGAALTGFCTRLDGRLRAIRVDDGCEIACDVAVVGIGAACRPISTDACGRTAIAHVYACGDVANAWRPRLGRRVRSEHWTNAAGQGVAVAHAILGENRPFDDVPYFWSDQFGLRLQHVGDGHGFTAVDIAGDGDAFRARYLRRDGRLQAVLLANRPTEVGHARRELAVAA